MNPIKISENPIISNLYEINSHHNLIFYNENCNDATKHPISLGNVPSLLEKHEAPKIIHILNRNVISLPGEKLGRSNIVSANIDTNNHHPIYTKQYPLPHKQREIITEFTIKFKC